MDVGAVVKVEELNGKDVLGSFLGEFSGREWYWHLDENVPMWRVPDIREAIAAPPGYKVLSADYSQIEVKLMAKLSGDPVLIAAINSKKDIHCYTATEVFGKKLNFTYEDMAAACIGKDAKQHPRHKELKRLRTNIKFVTFGVPYGAGAGRIAEQAGISKEEAQQFIDDFFAKFVVLKQWLENQGNQALNFGFTSTPNGRRRTYVMPNKDDVDFDGLIAQIRRWAGNHPIQAANADMLKMAIRLIYLAIRGGIASAKKLYDARLSLVVHDEIVMICADEDVIPVAAIMKRAMDEAYEWLCAGIWNDVEVVVDQIWEKV